MRSIKEYVVNVDGFRFISGNIYVLEFPNRSIFSRYIFEFDSICFSHDEKHIMHRNKWYCDGIINECEGVESLVTVPCGEVIRFRRYWRKINWDELCEG